MTKRLSRVSASSIKALTQCTLAFYYERALGLPTKDWPRTIIGVLCHSILECLRNPRHVKHYETVVVNGKVDWAASPVVARLVRWYQRKHGIAEDLIVDLNGMLYVGMMLIDYQWTKADLDPITGKPLIYGPEHEFLLTLDDGTQIKGYIDDMAQVGGQLILRDYKSQRERFGADELLNNIQAYVYMLYAYQAFGKVPRVEFVLLRHPPTKRTPTKHLQVVEPVSPAHLAGLAEYIKSVAARVRTFGLEEALAAPCDDIGFCQRVCTHYAPHPYWVVCGKDDHEGLNPLSSHLSLDKAREACNTGDVVLEREHKGCLARWRQ